MAILQRAKLGPYEVATHPGLALVAIEEGFDVQHIVLSDAVFTYPHEKLPGYTMPRAEFDAKIAIDAAYFTQARAHGLQTIVVSSLSTEPLKELLTCRGPLLAMTDSVGALHDIVVRGYRNETFKVVDPAQGYLSEHAATLLPRLHTRYGLSVLSIAAAHAG